MLSVWEYSQLTIIFLYLITIVVAIGDTYEFVYYSEDMFEDCPGEKGMHDLYDLSEFHVENFDGFIRVSGNLTNKVKDVDPTDRFQSITEVYKFGRGKWQPTPLSLVVNDICKEMVDHKSFMYSKWYIHVPPEDLKCFSEYGHTYHFEPFNVESVLDFSVNMEGRYKIEIFITIIPSNNENPIRKFCCIIYGELIKKQ
ncbi:uncharacterized protein LOC142228994 [Haematobia irritans]|uniref:uncharacterized protein LOC142228994 n=1 Tax=Haematobia irritans TaxID=7368 RepID=UPI003F4FE398